jgi:hypothetical protein
VGEEMTAIPPASNDIANLIDAVHEARPDSPRPHLGASIIGHECRRYLWYSFHWSVLEKHPGRIVRLFRRGNLEEAQIISDLRAIGIDVRTAEHINFGGHVGGTPDGIAFSGVPEAPKKKHILEFKTHALKSFNALLKDGVEKSKPLHFTQMQAYMLGTHIDRALYVAVCKDDDRIYTERVHLEKERAELLIRRAHAVTQAEEAPERISQDPSWFACKFCPAHAMCHDKAPTSEVNCRTCAHSTACNDGSWHCARWQADIPDKAAQMAGCEMHVLHPDLVPWERRESESDWEAVYVIDGKPVRNGEPGMGVYTSKELLANPSACAAGDEGIEALREAFNGRVEG